MSESKTKPGNAPPESAPPVVAPAAAVEETTDQKLARERREALAEFEKDKESGGLDTGYVVAPGKSVTSKIGIIDAGQAVAPKHFFGGQDDFARLIEADVIRKAPKKS